MQKHSQPLAISILSPQWDIDSQESSAVRCLHTKDGPSLFAYQKGQESLIAWKSRYETERIRTICQSREDYDFMELGGTMVGKVHASSDLISRDDDNRDIFFSSYQHISAAYIENEEINVVLDHRISVRNESNEDYYSTAEMKEEET
jgi:hypothetical protein